MDIFERDGYNGKYLIKAAFPYFMVGRGDWERRLRLLSDAGFNCVDVCLAWSRHEVEDGVWDFGGERDIDALFKLLGKVGLKAIVKPGPHVTFPYNAAGIPPFLIGADNTELARRMALWYGKVLPVVKRHSGIDGAIIGMTAEVDERDDEALSAVKSAFESYGLTIPTETRKVGINEPLRAISGSEGARAALIAGKKSLDFGFCVGGFSFGFNNTLVSNGRDVMFGASSFDSGALITAFGGDDDNEFSRMRLFKLMLSSFGRIMFGGSASLVGDVDALADKRETKAVKTSSYELGGGVGRLTSCHLDGGEKEPLRVTLSDKGRKARVKEFPKHTSITVRPGGSRFVLRGLDLSVMGLDGFLEYCTAEVLFRKSVNGAALVALLLDGEGEFCVGGDISVLGGSMRHESRDGLLYAWFDRESDLKFTINGVKTRVVALNLDVASKVEFVDEQGVMSCVSPAPVTSKPAPKNFDITVSEAKTQAAFEHADGLRFEDNGVFDGFAWYKSELALPFGSAQRKVLGVIIEGGADVVSVYLDGKYAATRAPFGATAILETYKRERSIIADNEFEMNVPRFIALETTLDAGEKKSLAARVEAWGRAFRDDWTLANKFPALTVRSHKGVKSLSAVTMKRALPKHATVSANTREGAFMFGLCIDRENAGAGVYTIVNGKTLQPFEPHNRYINITGLLNEGDNAIEIRGGKGFERVYFMESLNASRFEIARLGADEFIMASRDADEMLKTRLPMALKRGSESFLSVDLTAAGFSPDRDYKAVISGRGLKVTAMLNGRVAGRCWLPCPNAPKFALGEPNAAFLPGKFFVGGHNKLLLYVEAVSDLDDCVLEDIIFSVI